MKIIFTCSLVVMVSLLGISQNLVVNGDFTAGTVGFTSTYTNRCTSPLNEAEYCVTTNANLVHGAWQPCTGRGGSGNMLVANGPQTPNLIVWQQTINVLPNTCYRYSVYATTVFSANPPKIKIKVNSQELSLQLSTTTCAWTETVGIWFSGSSSIATLYVYDDDFSAFGNDFALDDITFQAITGTCNVTLPINWLSLTANYSGNNYAVVKWSTNGENSSNQFVVEKSYDGINFETLTTVNSLGNTNFVNNYQIVDNTLFNGFNYYRIKHVDANGNFNFSTTVKINKNSIRNNGIKVIPNIVANNINLFLQDDIIGLYSVVIYNNVGKVLYSQNNLNSAIGSHKVLVPKPSWPAGIYYLKVTENTTNKSNFASFIISR